MAESDESPGSMALQVAENTVDIFKKPINPAPRKKKKVLDEDTYVKQVEKIIERDFFPDLENLKDKLEYLEAKEQNDIGKLRELYSKYSTGKDTPMVSNVQDSPATFETPVNQRADATPKMDTGFDEDSDASQSKKRKKKSKMDIDKTSKSMSLDAFLEHHTSEDNDSFEQIMEENERRFRAKNAWMFDAEKKHNNEHIPNLALPSTDEQQQAKRLAITGTSVQKDTRPKQVENWNYDTFNSVMFVPGEAPMSEARKIELAKKKKREISLENTKFEGNPFTETLSEAAMIEASAIQASKKEGKVGVDGKELGKESPKVNGYSFVTAPSPMPGVDASPLMTWGEVEGTPFQLDGSVTPLLKKQTPGPSYRIPKLPNRDRLGIQLAEELCQKNRDKKTKALNTARSSLQSPSHMFGQNSTQERLTSMSPAAQRLLSNKLVVQHGTDKALRAWYTPSPKGNRGSGTPGAITPKSEYLATRRLSNTPKVRKPKTPAASSESDMSLGLTDNLLQLPRRSADTESSKGSHRPQAADFF